MDDSSPPPGTSSRTKPPSRSASALSQVAPTGPGPHVGASSHRWSPSRSTRRPIRRHQPREARSSVLPSRSLVTAAILSRQAPDPRFPRAAHDRHSPQLPHGSNPPASQLWPSLTISHPLIGMQKRTSADLRDRTPCSIQITRFGVTADGYLYDHTAGYIGGYV